MIPQWLKSLFSTAIRAFKKFCKIAFPILLQIFIGMLKDFAIEVVGKLETTDLSNEERRKQAFREIEIEARRKGLQFKTSWIYLLIEVALQVTKQIVEKNAKR